MPRHSTSSSSRCSSECLRQPYSARVSDWSGSASWRRLAGPAADYVASAIIGHTGRALATEQSFDGGEQPVETATSKHTRASCAPAAPLRALDAGAVGRMGIVQVVAVSQWDLLAVSSRRLYSCYSGCESFRIRHEGVRTCRRWRRGWRGKRRSRSSGQTSISQPRRTG